MHACVQIDPQVCGETNAWSLIGTSPLGSWPGCTPGCTPERGGMILLDNWEDYIDLKSLSYDGRDISTWYDSCSIT